MEENAKSRAGTTSRRGFLGKTLAVGAGAIGAGLVADGFPAVGAEADGSLSTGDIAILRFLGALERLEVDFWGQYNELGGVQDSELPAGTGNPAYIAALEVLDGDMPQYIHDNTDDEVSHFNFISAYLQAHGASAANLDQFQTLQGSKATGAQKNVKRLTNLMQLTVDTTFWTKYRSSTGNPDPPFNSTFPQAVPGLANGQFPAIPRDDKDLSGSTSTMPSPHLQAIANTAGFHFAMIEQAGSSLYLQLAQRVTSKEVLRILLSIGPTEVMHFQTWHDKAGNAPALTDPTNGLTFPNLVENGNEDTQSNLIMPEPTVLLNRAFPACSIIRPTDPTGAAQGAVAFLTQTGLFRGQSQSFFNLMTQLAQAADAA